MKDEKQFNGLASQLVAASEGLHYPATPDLAAGFLHQAAVRPQRRLSLAFAAALVVLVSLLAVPEVRARIVEFLQIGGVRITVPQEQPTRFGTETSEPLESGEHGLVVPVNLLDGETTLAQAREEVNFSISLPTYTDELGEPDRVFVQDFDRREFVIIVWEDEAGGAELALYILGPGVQLTKSEPETLNFVTINGNVGAWVTGNHFLFFGSGCCEGILVQAPALVWQVGELTYRIESALPFNEVIRIAESIN
jgi:hypothetical protein